MMRAEQNYYNQRANLNLEVQIFAKPFRALFILMRKGGKFIATKASGSSGFYKYFLWFLLIIYVISIFCPVTLICYLVLGYS